MVLHGFDSGAWSGLRACLRLSLRWSTVPGLLSKLCTMLYVLARSDAPFYEVAPTQGGRRHERAGPSAARHLED